MKRQTCLHLASKAGYTDTVYILLGNGCDITLVDIHGLSPVHYAVCHNRSEVIQLMFEERHEQLSRICVQCNHLGKTILHYHAESPMCSTEMISILLELGCDVDKLDAKGNCALSQYLRSFHSFANQIWRLCTSSWAFKQGRNSLDGPEATKSSSSFNATVERWQRSYSWGSGGVCGHIDERRWWQGIEHHGAIHGAFNKSLTRFLRKRGHLHLHSRDSRGKTPFEYAEEEANRERHRDLFEGRRWQRSLQNLRDADQNDWLAYHMLT